MFQIQFRGTWAGTRADRWEPAITGTLNQTGVDDETASMFDTREEAEAVLDSVVRPASGDSPDVEFRIDEVDVD
jgi:hypothetical protein